MSHERILVVEDDLIVRKVLESKLRAEGYEAVVVATAMEAVHAAQEKKPDLMVLDLTLVGDSDLNGILDGFSLLSWLRYTLDDSNFHVIINTADPSPSVDSRAVANNVYAVFRKERDLSALLTCIRQALDERQAA